MNFIFSSLSSGINAMSAVVIEDIVKVFISPNISNARATVCVKIMGKWLNEEFSNF